MERNRTYEKLLDAFQKPGCPICDFILEDSSGYLDSVMYERVMDVPTRLELIDSFGFCSWHAWQIPSLPAISSPASGYAILASDLLRKFDLVTQAWMEKPQRSRLWKLPLGKLSRKLFSLIKSKPCPACIHTAQFESYYFKALLEFIRDEDFSSAYEASDGICLPHFFCMERSFSNHRNFHALTKSQLGKIQTLRSVLEQFLRKQDHRFQDQLTAGEAKSWQVAMELLAGKPGVFHNEMNRDRAADLSEKLPDEISPARFLSHQPTIGELLDEARTANETIFYLKGPLAPDLVEELNGSGAFHGHSAIQVVVEDSPDIRDLRSLHDAGISLFYGVGLPVQPVVFIERKRGYLLPNHGQRANRSVGRLKSAEDLYFTLLWRRFGHAVVAKGTVKEKDAGNGFFSLAADGGREWWCRLKDPEATALPELGATVEAFGWEKWHSHVLEVLELKELEPREAHLS